VCGVSAPPPATVLRFGGAVRAAQSILGVLLLASGTALIGYCAYLDLAHVPDDERSPQWTRPMLLVPAAMACLFAGALVLRGR